MSKINVLSVLLCIFGLAKALDEKCLLRPYAGEVKAGKEETRNTVLSYSYSPEENECYAFSYGGFGGNANHFKSLEACQSACKQKSPCRQQPFSGNGENGPSCLMEVEAWSYVADVNKCVEYTYGGCGGNNNNFISLEECEKTCKEEDPCQQKPFSGNTEDGPSCFMSNEAWSYVVEKNECVYYEYTCGGNTNVFKTPEECERKCLQPKKI